jgi:hypothetical protein
MARLVALFLALTLILSAATSADEHRSDRAGHPLEIIGTVLHPVGVILDYLIFRPAHWVSHQEPVKTLTGHELDGAPAHKEDALTGNEDSPTGNDED